MLWYIKLSVMRLCEGAGLAVCVRQRAVSQYGLRLAQLFIELVNQNIPVFDNGAVPLQVVTGNAASSALLAQQVTQCISFMPYLPDFGVIVSLCQQKP